MTLDLNIIDFVNVSWPLRCGQINKNGFIYLHNSALALTCQIYSVSASECDFYKSHTRVSYCFTSG